ncbi:MAG TPA: FKBP-type peptidyl-prolyl cis-trans isomerase [Fimbriimonadaceae bacterium]|jgi:FKBP-type peptidyl-prolyl cis-trans isomerase
MFNSLLLALTLIPSGQLVVKDVHVGSGPAAAKGDDLTMLYKGTLSSGKVFDQNMDKAPFVFTLGGGEVIKGWDKGLVGMKVGGERKLTIPSDLAYGAQGAGSDIPPNATLVFDVKLLRIDKPNEKPKDQITDLKPGKGKAAKNGSKVTVYYTGTFLNGFKFDSSYDHKENGKPFPLAVVIGSHGVVPGFEQALIGMKAGMKRKVVIPYQLAYGAEGRPPQIPGKSTLVFVLEGISVE